MRRSLVELLRHSIKISIVLVFVILRHPKYKAMRNEVGNFAIIDKEDNFLGYIDYFNGELEVVKEPF